MITHNILEIWEKKSGNKENLHIVEGQAIYGQYSRHYYFRYCLSRGTKYINFLGVCRLAACSSRDVSRNDLLTLPAELFKSTPALENL